MKKPFSCCAILLPMFAVGLGNSSRAAVVIDSFDTYQYGPGITETRTTADGSGIIGGERDMIDYLRMWANYNPPGQLFLQDPTSSGQAGQLCIFTYDGNDNDASSGRLNGLGSVDLTGGGAYDRFQLGIIAVAGSGSTLQINVYQHEGFNLSSVCLVNLPESPGMFDIPFSSFVNREGWPAVNFASVGSLEFEFCLGAKASITIDDIVTIPEPSAVSLALCVTPALVALRMKGRREQCHI